MVDAVDIYTTQDIIIIIIIILPDSLKLLEGSPGSDVSNAFLEIFFFEKTRDCKEIGVCYVHAGVLDSRRKGRRHMFWKNTILCLLS